VRAKVDVLLAELHSTLQGSTCAALSARALDMTPSFGERLSALIVASYLDREHGVFVDSRDFLVTDDAFTHATVRSADQSPGARPAFSVCSSARHRPFPSSPASSAPR